MTDFHLQYATPLLKVGYNFTPLSRCMEKGRGANCKNMWAKTALPCNIYYRQVLLWNATDMPVTFALKRQESHFTRNGKMIFLLFSAFRATYLGKTITPRGEKRTLGTDTHPHCHVAEALSHQDWWFIKCVSASNCPFSLPLATTKMHLSDITARSYHPLPLEQHI